MRINIGRIFETSKIIATKAGRETSDGWYFLADLSEQVIRALSRQLNFTDNLDCLVQDVELEHNVTQIVFTGSKTPVHILPTRVVGESLVTVSAFGWRINQDLQTEVQVSYGNATGVNSVRLLIFFS
jgi:hypothetical protein